MQTEQMISDLIREAIPGAWIDAREMANTDAVMVAFSDNRLGTDGKMATGHIVLSRLELRKARDVDALVRHRTAAAIADYTRKQAAFAA